MNKVILIGNLTRDPDTRYSTGENATCIARFSIAVQRMAKKADGTTEADFINCVAFGKTGEFIEKYFKKGSKIAISGRIQTGSYTNKDGVKVYTTDVVCENVEFCSSKKSDGEKETNTKVNDGFVDIPDDVDDDSLPFN